MAKTGSEVAQNILDNFDIKIQDFTKVFPYEYQRALKDLEEEKAKMAEITEKNGQNGKNGHDEQNGKNGHDDQNGKNGHCEAKISDIEDSVMDVDMKKKKMEILDKTRGFVKYDREKRLYKDAKSRQDGWDEIYDFKTVRKGMGLCNRYILFC